MPEQREPGFYNDEIDIIVEGPGDNTIRPCRPERFLHLLKEREKLIKWGYLKPAPLPPHAVAMLKQLEAEGKIPPRDQPTGA